MNVISKHQQHREGLEAFEGLGKWFLEETGLTIDQIEKLGGVKKVVMQLLETKK